MGFEDLFPEAPVPSSPEQLDILSFSPCSDVLRAGKAGLAGRDADGVVADLVPPPPLLGAGSSPSDAVLGLKLDHEDVALSWSHYLSAVGRRGQHGIYSVGKENFGSFGLSHVSCLTENDDDIFGDIDLSGTSEEVMTCSSNSTRLAIPSPEDVKASVSPSSISDLNAFFYPHLPASKSLYSEDVDGLDASAGVDSSRGCLVSESDVNAMFGPRTCGEDISPKGPIQQQQQQQRRTLAKTTNPLHATTAFKPHKCSLNKSASLKKKRPRVGRRQDKRPRYKGRFVTREELERLLAAEAAVAEADKRPEGGVQYLGSDIHQIKDTMDSDPVEIGVSLSVDDGKYLVKSFFEEKMEVESSGSDEGGIHLPPSTPLSPNCVSIRMLPNMTMMASH